MSAKIIDGRQLAKYKIEALRPRIDSLVSGGFPPRLDAIVVLGEHSGDVYAASQERACKRAGIGYYRHELPQGVCEDDLLNKIISLNEDSECSAIMLNMPLPHGHDSKRAQSLIDPSKDVEGANPANIGNVVHGNLSLIPCTAKATMVLIKEVCEDLRGKVVAVVGAGDVVGKPITILLMREEATVFSTNVHTIDLKSLVSKADIVVAAAGVPNLIKGDMVKSGAIVIDVGISRIQTNDGTVLIAGDVEQHSVELKSSAISPVPGGVGPVTVAMLLENVIEASERAFSQRLR